MRLLLLLLGTFAATLTFLISKPAAVRAQNPAEPFAHCRRVGNQDDPPGEPPAWMRAMAPSASPLGIVWRCMDGQVLTCAGVRWWDCIQPDQSRQPSDAMLEHCRRQPNGLFGQDGEGLRNSIHSWRCSGGRPILTGLGSAAGLDGRGFRRAAWTVAAPTAQASAPPPVSTREIYPTRAEFEATGTRGAWSCSPSPESGSVLLRSQPGGAVMGRVPPYAVLLAVRQGADGWTWFQLSVASRRQGWARADLIGCDYIHPE